jgi:hypothetical protein
MTTPLDLLAHAIHRFDLDGDCTNVAHGQPYLPIAEQVGALVAERRAEDRQRVTCRCGHAHKGSPFLCLECDCRQWAVPA